MMNLDLDLDAWQLVVFAVLYAAAILAAGWVTGQWGRSLLLQILRARRLDEALARFLASAAQYAILAAAIIAALSALGIETTSLVAVFASAGLAIGLALQGSLASLASGVLILFFRPFDLGQVITTGGFTGRVDDIGLFSIRLITADNQTIILPNSAITAGSIVNLSAQGHRRIVIPVGVAYGVDLAQVQQVLLAAVQDLPGVRAEPAPGVALVEFGDSALSFSVGVSADNADLLRVQHEARVAIYNALAAARIEMPYPQLVIHRAVTAAAAAGSLGGVEG